MLGPIFEIGYKAEGSWMKPLYTHDVLHQFQPQDPHQNQKNISYPMVCSGQEMLRWMQSYALRGLFGHVCLRKG